MATAAKKPAAKPVAKAPVKPAAKPAAKSAAKPAAKPAAPAPAPAAKPAPKKTASKKAEPVDAVVEGSFVTFNGYPEGTPAEDIVLVEGESYEVVELTNVDGVPGYALRCPNPDFDPAQPENDDTNPAEIEADVFPNEVTLVTDEAEQAAEVAEVAEKPAKAPRTAAKAPAKGKTLAKVKEAAPVVTDELPELENENEDVLTLVNESTNLVDTARDLEAEVGATEFKLGGLLYHIKKDGAYKQIDERYADNKGFAAFVEDHFNFSYRKAMNLIEIYVEFTVAGITDAADVIASIGWAKAAKIAGLLNEEGQNADELIELAQNNTSEGLSEAIKEQTVSVGGVAGDKKKRTTLKLRYWEDEAAGITETLERVKAEQGLGTVEEAFAFIVAEFESAAGEAAPVAAAPKQTAAPARRAGAANAEANAAAAKPAARRATAKA